jgi:hypothetical protein
MLKVVSFLKCLANTSGTTTKSAKEDILTRFIDGVNSAGDNGVVSNENQWEPCDVAVILGYIHKNSSKSKKNLVLRKQIIDIQKQSSTHVVIVDSNLFNYFNAKSDYLRYSLNGIFPTTGNYFIDHSDPQRWRNIQKDLGICLKPRKTMGNHILLCGQRNFGWSMGDLPVRQWANETTHKLKQYTDREIVFRPHPADRAKKSKYINHINCNISQKESILDDFENAHAVVTYNSSPGVASAIEGISTFVTDPSPMRSQAFEVANFDLSQIENPLFINRQQWIERICMSHWKLSELSDGSAWKHMRQYI